MACLAAHTEGGVRDGHEFHQRAGHHGADGAVEFGTQINRRVADDFEDDGLGEDVLDMDRAGLDGQPGSGAAGGELSGGLFYGEHTGEDREHE